MAIKNTTYKRFGFFTALSMVIGSVVGIGIFFKNGGVFATTEGNSISVLIAWILGGIISLFAALSFAEVFRDDRGTTEGGLAGLAERYVGAKFGRFVKYAYTFFYMPTLISVFPLFIYIFLSLFLGADMTAMGAFTSMLVGAIGLIMVSTLLPRVTSSILNISLVLKMLPLVTGALAGLFFTKGFGGIGNDLDTGIRISSNKGVFSLALAAMPGVLFAFDAFANVGAISTKVKNANRNVPLAIFGGMIFVAALYLLITISQINHASGSITGLLTSVFSGKSALIPTMVFGFIVISATGTANSITLAGVYQMETLLFERLAPGSQNYKETKLPYKGGLAMAITVVVFVSVNYATKLFLLDPAGPGDGYLDALSNMPTLFFFPIYAIIFIGLVKTKITRREFDGRSIYFYVIAIISTLGIFTVVGYQFYKLFSDFANFDAHYIANTALIIGLVQFLLIPFFMLAVRNYQYDEGGRGKLLRSIANAFKLELT